MIIETWHMTFDMWHMERGEHSLKISDLKLLQFGSKDVLTILTGKAELVTRIIITLFVEQPQVHRVR